MQQVPHYAVIGNGRMATHMCFYLSALGLTYQQWHRQQGVQALITLLHQSTHVLVLITDQQIQPFIENYLLHQSSALEIVHFSGALTIKGADSAHPLQSFVDKKAYSLEEYKAMPFILSNPNLTLNDILPGLPNAAYYVPPEQRPYYHAMCVLANNVSTILWHKFYAELQTRYGIESKHIRPFLQRTFQNIADSNGTALSGPIARHDHKTLQKNIEALEGDPLQGILKCFNNEAHTKK